MQSVFGDMTRDEAAEVGGGQTRKDLVSYEKNLHFILSQQQGWDMCNI